MRAIAIVALLGSTAAAGPIARVGVVGGFDSSAPGGKDDGLTAAVGYRSGAFTAAADYAYYDYDSSTGVAGGAHHVGLLAQAQLASAHCDPGLHCTHFDLDVGVGRRWVTWQPAGDPGSGPWAQSKAVDVSGRELSLGASLTFGWRFGLHYMMFRPDPATTMVVCRGICPMQTQGDANGVLLDVTWQFGS